MFERTTRVYEDRDRNQGDQQEACVAPGGPFRWPERKRIADTIRHLLPPIADREGESRSAPSRLVRIIGRLPGIVKGNLRL
jgi:hypothetical protein